MKGRATSRIERAEELQLSKVTERHNKERKTSKQRSQRKRMK